MLCDRNMWKIKQQLKCIWLLLLLYPCRIKKLQVRLWFWFEHLVLIDKLSSHDQSADQGLSLHTTTHNTLKLFPWWVHCCPILFDLSAFLFPPQLPETPLEAGPSDECWLKPGPWRCKKKIWTQKKTLACPPPRPQWQAPEHLHHVG